MSSLKNRIPFFPYKVIVWILHYVCLFFFKIEIKGREKVIEWKKKNRIAFVAIARHKSYWDPIFLSVAFGASDYTIMNYVTKKELSKFLGKIPFAKNYITFIDREKTKKSTIENSSNLLAKGVNLAVFPEGTTIPERKKMNRGIIFLIKKAEEKIKRKIPIFPLNIKTEGPYGNPEGKWYLYLLRRVKVELRIGDPIFLEDIKGKDKGKEMVKIILEKTDQI
jgi:1-acyl-sn-glycerol-3-phosphate acyltransferase